MDGNGRWAKARGLDRSEGHVEGVNTVRRITEVASELGIGYLTLYTFSTENWNRPKAEVDALMHLIVIAIERETPDLIKNNPTLSAIFKGIRPAVVALIIAPVISSAKAAKIGWKTAVIPVGVALLIFSKLPVVSNPILYIVLGGFFGWLWFSRNVKALHKVENEIKKEDEKL